MPSFKTRARALDMLGRQQIAGIPTAISELFKNAHDAYADNVIVDYYRKDRLFVLRDDGIGMTKADFEDRWLALGTESKLGTGIGLAPPPVAKDKPLRPTLGEKGIGRLAIAAIGQQVLILTRAEREGALHDLVVAFIHWGIFECPGLDLNEINIPVKEFPGSTIPDELDVQVLVSQFKENLDRLIDKISPDSRNRILADLENFTVNPQQIQKWVGSPRLIGEGHGTHFIILPADESLTVQIESNDGDGERESPLIKALMGFANTMTPNHEYPSIRCRFRYHRVEEYADDLIEESDFWNPDDFKVADHYVQGIFDEFGQFDGSVRVFGQKPKEYRVPWSGALGTPTACGPFKIDFGYVQGRMADSIIPPEIFPQMYRKVTRIGGLYIYRDGIRVLPYGDNDFDFLDMERRRLKGAGYYFFSYRRIFGAIQMSRRYNSGLTEKAGREGFHQNKAYRELKSILINFYTQLAADFFRETGIYSEAFIEGNAELKRREEARRKREKQANEQRRILQESIDVFFTQVTTGKPTEETESILRMLAIELDFVASTTDPQEAAARFLKAESDAREQLASLRDKFRVTKPSGLSLTKPLQREWDAYQIERRKLENVVFNDAAKQIFEITDLAAREANLNLDRRLRLERVITERGAVAQDLVRKDGAVIRTLRSDALKKVNEVIQWSRIEVEEAVRNAHIVLNTLDVRNLGEGELVQESLRLEERIVGTLDRSRESLNRIKNRLSDVSSFDVQKPDAVDEEQDAKVANEEKVLDLERQVSENLELAQLGMAISIVDHEFGAVVRSLRGGLRTIKPYTTKNTRLNEAYTRLNDSFESLDAYLKLFTPLQKRLYRKQVRFHGSDIESFVEKLFHDRLVGKINLIVRTEFRQAEIVGYPSTFYQVFVNLVDNAIFWCSQPRVEDPWIRLDANGRELLISDSGPGVELRHRETVFEFGFTRKPDGRGVGLFVSRQSLERDGYALTIKDTPTGRGSMFSISPKEELDDSLDNVRKEEKED